jgi:hypothetical protein
VSFIRKALMMCLGTGKDGITSLGREEMPKSEVKNKQRLEHV